MFSLFISFQFLSAKCWCSVSIHTLIDVASVMFAEECCYFFVIRTYSDGVVFTRVWADHDEAADGQLDWLCYSHIYLFDTDFYWVALLWYLPSCSVGFRYFLPGRILWMCCVGKRLPLNHLTMLCCHVAYLKKKKKYCLWIALALWIQFSSCFYKFV